MKIRCRRISIKYEDRVLLENAVLGLLPREAKEGDFLQIAET
jgi:hypothetical protein